MSLILHFIRHFICRYEDAFNRFVDEINALAAYQWWEGSIYSILCVLAYPLAWSWQQWRRRKKLQRLREFVRSEYDHACLRSCRSRALYEGLKVFLVLRLILRGCLLLLIFVHRLLLVLSIKEEVSRFSNIILVENFNKTCILLEYARAFNSMKMVFPCLNCQF